MACGRRKISPPANTNCRSGRRYCPPQMAADSERRGQRCIGPRVVQIETRLAARAQADQRQQYETTKMRCRVNPGDLHVDAESVPCLLRTRGRTKSPLRSTCVRSSIEFAAGLVYRRRHRSVALQSRRRRHPVGAVMIDAAGVLIDTIRYSVTTRATGDGDQKSDRSHRSVSRVAAVSIELAAVEGPVGAFYAPISLENRTVGWDSLYSISSSAINTWLGEELRTIGLETSLTVLGATAGRNFDVSVVGRSTAGTIRPAFCCSSAAGALTTGRPRCSAICRDPSSRTRPFPTSSSSMKSIIEWVITRALEAKISGRHVLRALHYDNRGDTSKQDAREPDLADPIRCVRRPGRVAARDHSDLSVHARRYRGRSERRRSRPDHRRLLFVVRVVESAVRAAPNYCTIRPHGDRNSAQRAVLRQQSGRGMRGPPRTCSI